MKFGLITREFERDLDYDWEDYFPSDKALLSEARKFHSALEGSYADDRFAALLRPCYGAVTLCVSVSTNRRDSPGRPIRTIVVAQSGSPADSDLLIRFFAECLSRHDDETLYKPESDVAKSVESLYQTKRPDEFIRYCKSLNPVGMARGTAKERRSAAFPRGDMDERSALVATLPALLDGGSPFLFAIVERQPDDVLEALGSMFDKAEIGIFSQAVAKPQELRPHSMAAEGTNSQKYIRAAAIGGAVIIGILVAAIGSCSGDREGDEKGKGDIVVDGQETGRENDSSPSKSARQGEKVERLREINTCTNSIAPNVKAGATGVKTDTKKNIGDSNG